MSNHSLGLSLSMLDGEEKLIERAIQGESSAFGSLYDYYQPKIYRFVLIKVGRREEAEDLTHQVFLNAWQNIKTYQARGFPVSSWFYRIAKNLIIDHYRTRKENLPLDETDPERFAVSGQSDANLDDLFELERVKKAVRELKAEHQDVIILRFVEDLSIKETAAALQKSEGAVKLIQHRALKQLRQLLEQA